MKPGQPICGQTIWLVAAGWFLLALFAGETELLAQLPGPAAPAIVLGLTVLLLIWHRFSPCLRSRVATWSDRQLVSLHLTRLVGIYFLLLASRGELDPRFAVPAGWGDIVVAAGAVALLLSPGGSVPFLVWNCLGMADILFVVGRAASLRLSDPAALGALTRLPLSFLPTLLVPLIIASHLLIFARFRERRRKKEASAESDFAAAS